MPTDSEAAVRHSLESISQPASIRTSQEIREVSGDVEFDTSGPSIAEITESPSQLSLPANNKNSNELHNYITSFFNTIKPNKTGAYVSVKHMNCAVKIEKNGTKEILKDISFYLRPGMMTLLLGNPGGGRSTLLKVLANCSDPGTVVGGQVLFNNHQIDKKTHHRDVSYIVQHDVHLPTLTVRETLEFSAGFIIPTELSDATARSKRLDVLLNILGLERCQHTVLGNEFIRGVSGGEKKRVTVGVDLMKGAEIILMDEPTTGLDSVTTVELMQYIRAVTDSGQLSSLVALLQPPQEAFDIFDHVMILCEGEIAYFGSCELAVPYFESLGFSCPVGMNPAEFLQEVVTFPGDYFPGGEPSLVTPSDFATAFRQTREFEEILSIVSDPTKLIPDGVKPIDSVGKNTYVASPIRQFQLCLSRALKLLLRNRIALIARYSRIILLGIILGTLFVNVGTNQHSVLQRQAFLFYSILLLLYSSLITIRDLYDQRPVFYEQRDLRKWYRTLPYFLAYVTPDFVVGLIEVSIFTIITYWLLDLRSGSARALYFLLALYSIELIGFAFNVVVSAFTPTSLYAGALVPLLETGFALVSGFIIPKDQIPGWWIWTYWISPLHYTYEGLLINDFSGLSFHCSPDQMQPPLGTPGFDGAQVCPITSGDEVLSSSSFHTQSWFRWIDLLVSFGWTFFYLFVAFLAICFYNQRPRGGGMPQYQKQKRSRLHRKKFDDNMAMNVTEQAHSDLQVYGAYFTFSDISYYVPGTKGDSSKSSATEEQKKPGVEDGNEIRLLSNVNGYVRPGSLLALMGSSGAGKSTLLDVLAGRKNSGRIVGEVLINGKKPDHTFTRYAAYVTQADILHPAHTVREAVQFSAMCRLPEKVSKAEKLQFAEKILVDLNLKKIENRVIGTPGFGISPEQAKRLNIAIELASNPQLIFLDEPTSGLDSSAARKVMKLIKKLTLQGRSVICTIHQPSAEIFSFFDSLLLLTTCGRTVYFGPTGPNGETFLQYCSKHGHEMEAGRNVADFALEFSSGNAKEDKQDSTAPPPTVLELISSFYESPERAETVSIIKDPEFVPHEFKPPVYHEKYASSFMTQVGQNLHRAFVSLYKRNKLAIFLLVGRMGFFGIFVGTLYIHRLGHDQNGITNRAGFIFYSAFLTVFIGFAWIPVVAGERGVFYHEQASGAYRSLTYAVASIVSSLPIVVMTIIPYAIPAYYIPTFDSHHHFGGFAYFVLIMILTSMAFGAMSHFFGVAAPHEGIAITLLTLVAPVWVLFAGFWIPRTQIHGWWIWTYYLSFMHYIVEGVSIESFAGITFHCKPDQYLNVVLPDSSVVQYCQYTDFHSIVDRFGILSSWKWIDVGILSAFSAIFVVLVCFSLAKIRYEKT